MSEVEQVPTQPASPFEAFGIEPTQNIGAFAQTLNALPPVRKAAIKEALAKAYSQPIGAVPARLEKTVSNSSGLTTAFGLVTYSLETPALNLWPVVTKFRNLLPRVPTRSTGHNWKRITKIDTAESYGFVAEPTDTTASTNAGRAGFMQWNEVDDSVTFATLGLDNYISYQARYAGGPQGGQDFRPDEIVRLATLQAMMMREEKAIIGGSVSALGNVTGITKTGVTQLATTVGNLPGNTASIDIQVTALTLRGYRLGSKGKTGGVDALGETSAAAKTTIATTATGNAGDKSVTITWTPIVGAVAYNVFVVAASGTPVYYTTVTSNHCAITDVGSTVVVNAADQSADANGFDGLIKLLGTKAGYIKNLGTVTAAATWTGTNTTVNEIDAACYSLFTTYQVGPTEWFVSPYDRNAIKNIIVGASAPYMRVNLTDGQNSVTGGLSADAILNQYTGVPMKITTHPYLPQGTAIGWCNNLGEYYPNANLPAPAEMRLGFDYLSVDWAPTSLRQEFGVYMNGALALKAGFPFALIQNAS